jgi:hypothetical protein
MHPFNSMTRPIPSLLAFFVETDDLLPHPIVELPSEARVVLLPHDLLGIKQRAVNGAELEQLLRAQHVHYAGIGSLGVPSMLPVEGRCVDVDVVDGGSLGGSMALADGGALIDVTGGLQPSSAQGAHGRRTAAAALP